MKPWGRSQFHSGEALCAYYLPDEWVLGYDLALHIAGWRVPHDLALVDQVLELQDFKWASSPYPLEIVNLKTIPTHQQVLDHIYLDSSGRATSEKLISAVEDLYELLGRKQFGEIELLFTSIDLARTAPEYAVGLLRATSKDIRHIQNWREFLDRVRVDLSRRGLEPEQVLVGLE
jgi:hypothetical protein